MYVGVYFCVHKIIWQCLKFIQGRNIITEYYITDIPIGNFVLLDLGEWLRHHNSRTIYVSQLQKENYHDCQIMVTFSTDKQATVQKVYMLLMIVDAMASCSTHKSHWNNFKQLNIQLELWKGRHQHHNYEGIHHDCSRNPLSPHSNVIPNWNLLGHLLKWVGKWPVMQLYFKLWGII